MSFHVRIGNDDLLRCAANAVQDAWNGAAFCARNWNNTYAVAYSNGAVSNQSGPNSNRAPITLWNRGQLDSPMRRAYVGEWQWYNQSHVNEDLLNTFWQHYTNPAAHLAVT